MKRLVSPGRKILLLGPSGWLLLLRACVALLRAHRTVRTRPRGTLFDELVSDGARVPRGVRSDARRVHEIGRAVERTARFGPIRAQCLVRSIALQRMLDAEGIGGARIRIGVRRGESGFQAHAWVEWEGEVVADTAEHVAAFLPLPDGEGAGAEGRVKLEWAEMR